MLIWGVDEYILGYSKPLLDMSKNSVSIRVRIEDTAKELPRCNDCVETLASHSEEGKKAMRTRTLVDLAHKEEIHGCRGNRS